MNNVKKGELNQNGEKENVESPLSFSISENSNETNMKKKVKKVSFLLDKEENHIKKDEGSSIDDSSEDRMVNIQNGINLNNKADCASKKCYDNTNDNIMKYNYNGKNISSYNIVKQEDNINNSLSCASYMDFDYKDNTNDFIYEKQERYEKNEKNEKIEKYDKREFTDNEKDHRRTNIHIYEEEIKDILNEDEVKDVLDEREVKNDLNERKVKEALNENRGGNKKDGFEKSYNDSLNNYLSSSFVDILNTIHENKKDQSNLNGRKTSEHSHNNSNNDNSNNNGDHMMNASNPSNGKNYENRDFTDTLESDNLRLIPCILCGDTIKTNASKMCNNCILQNVESNSMNINKDTYLIYYCRECRRYLHNKWVYCELESKELLALCLKKVHKLKKLKILDAKFLYTEPHSKRIKIHLTVQEELINNFISEIELILHYVIKYTQCDDCKKKYTPYTYNTCVSVRQKVEHKKTLLFLESLLLKCNMNENIINIVSNPDGLDFHFLSRNDALKFCDFILSKTMSKYKNSKHLINHDASNNTYNYLYTFSIDICPICKFDLIFFPRDLSMKYGIKSSFYLCMHVSIFIILINPFCFLNNAHISQERYNKHPFLPLLSKADAKVFLILNVEYIDSDPYSKNKKKNYVGNKDNNNKLNNNSNALDDNNSFANAQGKNKNNIKNKNNLKRKIKNFTNAQDIEEYSTDDDYVINDDDKNSLTDTKSCKSSSRKVKLDKLVYAYVELYDESNGNTILTKTCNAKHLKPGDYVNAYDLRKHTFDNEISLYLEKNDNYNIIIIDRVKSKERQKIENELQVQYNNIETVKNINEEDVFKRIVLNNCRDIENMTIKGA
ncbi:60S ribosomal export protein NMD3 [Plasmodium brasilianum]|uniref:60S ribosomal export protein NMD3, putative n=2 Tax=Plasmodium (Plasmodium) TaxID=418103 RepID=A0A1A8VN71_PLAMA|nr:60S ribosomal export protein NMD3, putative [Plasmodium malariae]KAI4840991.1 60S ribosomal export protein NMD3 [Plasmodium brasilianum]SBS81809.1 60S ribosomal export protein NMD3, putative (NMD3) [Plasmodium malariae]SBT87193.1 60S ribosomal export protein NMD3, putative [Plasmodium malariae]